MRIGTKIDSLFYALNSSDAFHLFRITSTECSDIYVNDNLRCLLLLRFLSLSLSLTPPHPESHQQSVILRLIYTLMMLRLNLHQIYPRIAIILMLVWLCVCVCECQTSFYVNVVINRVPFNFQCKCITARAVDLIR